MKPTLKDGFKKLISNKLTALWLWISAASVFLGSFLVVTSEVQEASQGKVELVGSIDHFLISILSVIRTPHLNSIAIDITALGSATVVSVFVVSASLILLLKRQWMPTIHLLVSAAGSALLTLLMKPFFERPRPDGLIHLVDVQGFSYPSGHSLTSAAVYFTFAILISSTFQKWSHRVIVIGISSFIILLVALSRVYLGVHYFSDVLAGVLVGIGWAALLGGARSYLELRK